MSSYRVLVFTNLWSYEGDPSYGCFVRAKGVSAPARGWDACTPFWSRLEPRQGRNLWPMAAAIGGRQFPKGTSPLQRATPVDRVLVKSQDAPLPPRGSFFLKKRRCHS
jgi:hypothetical protein